MARPRVAEKEAVLDAAARTLAARGTGATTVDDVAEAAGVSRATVYRYLGGKDEIVAAVIGRETQQLLEQIEGLVPSAGTPAELIETIVVAAVDGIDGSPLLHRLNNEDRRETLPFITVDGAPLVGLVVESLRPVLRNGVAFELDPDSIEVALEEATRLVLSHLTTPRLDGGRLDSSALGARVAAMVSPLLQRGSSQQ